MTKHTHAHTGTEKGLKILVSTNMIFYILCLPRICFGKFSVPIVGNITSYLWKEIHLFLKKNLRNTSLFYLLVTYLFTWNIFPRCKMLSRIYRDLINSGKENLRQRAASLSLFISVVQTKQLSVLQWKCRKHLI